MFNSVLKLEFCLFFETFSGSSPVRLYFFSAPWPYAQNKHSKTNPGVMLIHVLNVKGQQYYTSEIRWSHSSFDRRPRYKKTLFQETWHQILCKQASKHTINVGGILQLKLVSSLCRIWYNPNKDTVLQEYEILYCQQNFSKYLTLVATRSE